MLLEHFLLILGCLDLFLRKVRDWTKIYSQFWPASLNLNGLKQFYCLELFPISPVLVLGLISWAIWLFIHISIIFTVTNHQAPGTLTHEFISVCGYDSVLKPLIWNCDKIVEIPHRALPSMLKKDDSRKLLYGLKILTSCASTFPSKSENIYFRIANYRTLLLDWFCKKRFWQ